MAPQGPPYRDSASAISLAPTSETLEKKKQGFLSDPSYGLRPPAEVPGRPSVGLEAGQQVLGPVQDVELHPDTEVEPVARDVGHSARGLGHYEVVEEDVLGDGEPEGGEYKKGDKYKARTCSRTRPPHHVQCERAWSQSTPSSPPANWHCP